MSDKQKVGLYVDISPDLKYQLERIAFERSKPGERVALRTVVSEALNEYVARHPAGQQEQRGGDAASGL